MEGWLLLFVWMPLFVVVVGGFVRWAVLRMSVTTPMEGLLDCDTATAMMALDYIKARGIDWIEFLELFYCAMNRLMPVFASPGQFTATWGETRLATIAILNKRLLTADTNRDQFVALVVAEIVARRGGGKSEAFRASFHDGQVTISPEDQILF